MSTQHPDVTGVILAGGRSTRFGTNKALAHYQGRTFLQHIVPVMEALFPELLFITNTPEFYPQLKIPMIRDDEPAQGPLGGICTALRIAKQDKIFVVACDMPLLKASDITHIIRAAAADKDAAVPIHGDRKECLLALYTRGLYPEMRRYLDEGHRSVWEFLDGRDRIAWVPITGCSFLNINTQQDLEQLEKNDARTA